MITPLQTPRPYSKRRFDWLFSDYDSLKTLRHERGQWWDEFIACAMASANYAGVIAILCIVVGAGAITRFSHPIMLSAITIVMTVVWGFFYVRFFLFARELRADKALEYDFITMVIDRGREHHRRMIQSQEINK